MDSPHTLSCTPPERKKVTRTEVAFHQGCGPQRSDPVYLGVTSPVCYRQRGQMLKVPVRKYCKPSNTQTLAGLREGADGMVGSHLNFEVPERANSSSLRNPGFCWTLRDGTDCWKTDRWRRTPQAGGRVQRSPRGRKDLFEFKQRIRETGRWEKLELFSR